MLSSGIPELQKVEDIYYLRDAFHLHLSDDEAVKLFTSLIEQSISNKSTQVNFLIHNLAHLNT
jgi:hypothetical protein